MLGLSEATIKFFQDCAKENKEAVEKEVNNVIDFEEYKQQQEKK